jgi:hypothetical protein
MANPVIAYVLDSHDRIISVSKEWNAFSDENGGKHSSSTDVIGQRIWDFVAGDATRMWLATVFQFARLCGTSIERPYRCDSPEMKRFMRMRIVSEQGGNLRIEHEVLATEQRPAPIHIHYGANTTKNTSQRCSICGRVNRGGWQDPLAEHADASNRIIVIYTVCEDCQRLMPGM